MKPTSNFQKGLSLSFTIICSLIFFSKALLAQEFYPNTRSPAFKAAIENEFLNYGADRYLYEHADAYQRLVQIHALQKMGYDFSASENPTEQILQSNPEDTLVEDISSAGTGDQDETTIAIGRTNPQIIIAGSNDIPKMVTGGMPSYYSLDAGRTWSISRIKKLSSSPSVLGDPAIVAGDSGYFYYAYLTALGGQNEDNLVVATSKDGKNWTNGGYVVPPDEIGGFEDKENICIDNNPSSPHYGRVYLVWVHFSTDGSGGGNGMISWSDDRCKTWSEPEDVMDSIIRFSEVRTGKNGEVFFSFSIMDDGGVGTGSHFLLVSQDGGQTFTRNKIADFVTYPPNQTNYPGLKGFEGIRAFPYIAHDVDQKTNQIHLVYGSWYDDGTGSNTPASVIYYVSSTNLGKTWTVPQPVGVSNPEFNTLDHDRFCPWVSVNQKTGEAYCSYYSSERDPDDLAIAAFRMKLTGGMKEYQHPLEQSDFDPTLLVKAQGVPFVGDYQGSDAYDSIYAASWTEGKGSVDGDIFVYIETPHSPNVTGSVPVVIRSSNVWLSPPIPNPSTTGLLNFSYYIPANVSIEIALYSGIGEKIKTLVQEKSETGTYAKQYSLAGLSSGTYILRLSTPYGNAERNVVIAK